LVQEPLADEVCKRNCTGQVLTAGGFPYKLCFVLYWKELGTNKHNVGRGGFCTHKLALSIEPWRFRSPTRPYKILWFFFAYLLMRTIKSKSCAVEHSRPKILLGLFPKFTQTRRYLKIL